MLDPIPQRLRDQPWGTITLKLTRYAEVALGRRRDARERAQEIAQEAIAQLFAPDEYQPWDPVRDPDLFKHLAKRVKGLVSNDRRARSHKHTVRMPYEKLASLPNADPNPSPDEALAKEEEAARALAMLRERLAGDDVGEKLLACYREQVDGAQEQASALGLSIEEVRNARKRLFRHVDAVRRALDAEDDDRLSLEERA